MIINHNMAAINSNRTLGNRSTEIQRNIEALSSGMRINRAADDASGLAVAETLTSQIRGLNQASRNVSDAVSFIQTTEGYLTNTSDILHRLRELSVQSANGIYSQDDRQAIQVEVSQLVDEVNRIASHAQFNGMNMLTGRFAEGAGVAQQDGISFHVGANVDQNEVIFVGTMTAEALGLDNVQGTGSIVSIADPVEANATIGTVDGALKKVNQLRADLGANLNRFELAKKGIDIASENMTAAESKIRDVDMASEMVDYVKNQILTQANTAMLAQANTTSQSVLSLL
jgi:flagellin